MTRVIVVLALLFALSAEARDEKYPVSAIPEALKKNVNAVVRDDETIFRIQSRSSATLYIHFAVTIFNANAKHYAEVPIHYNKRIEVIKDVKATAYDAEGNVIKKLKASDILDRAAYDGSLFSDDRLKFFDLSQAMYPYTVEWEYEVQYKYLYSIPGSTVGGAENVSVQNFRYQLTYPTDLKIRHKTHNIDAKPVVALVSANTESVTWQLKDVLPVTIEPMSSAAEQFPYIKAAPSQFEFEGYAGNMSSWEEYGKWLKLVNEGRDKLPDGVKQKIQELTKGLATTEEKAQAIYQYLQSKTRYVSIQLGIGGLQTFEASTVDQNGYGDCKALSNYMVAMLKEAGVKAYYTTIMAGDNAPPVDVSFPGHQANHVIVGVPNGRDTLWLECTSQTAPFGYIGRFTGNRYGLMITEAGGKLVKTKHYPGAVNVQNTSAKVTLDATGNAKAKVATKYSGLQYENAGLDFVINNSTDEQKKWIQENTQIPSFDVGKFSFSNKKEKIPSATVEMDLTLNKYASVSNKRLFVTPNLMNRSTFIPEKVENRKTAFSLGMAYTDIDTIRYVIPESIYPEFLPPTAKFSSKFGTYESGFKLEQGSLIYYRRMERNDGTFPPESYQELIDFYKNINKADNTKVVFLTKT